MPIKYYVPASQITYGLGMIGRDYMKSVEVRDRIQHKTWRNGFYLDQEIEIRELIYMTTINDIRMMSVNMWLWMNRIR